MLVANRHARRLTLRQIASFLLVGLLSGCVGPSAQIDGNPNSRSLSYNQTQAAVLPLDQMTVLEDLRNSPVFVMSDHTGNIGPIPITEISPYLDPDSTQLVWRFALSAQSKAVKTGPHALFPSGNLPPDRTDLSNSFGQYFPTIHLRPGGQVEQSLALYLGVRNGSYDKYIFTNRIALMSPSPRLRVSFMSEPEGASIFWNARLLGPTQKIFGVEPTEMENITISLPGWRPCRALDAMIPGWQNIGNGEGILVKCILQRQPTTR